jgi:hypothetical protein
MGEFLRTGPDTLRTCFADLLGFRGHVHAESLNHLISPRWAWSSPGSAASRPCVQRVGLISDSMLGTNPVACAKSNGHRSIVLRPDDYGRAAIVNADQDAPPQSWEVGRDRLFDVKGVGTPAGCKPVVRLHGSGLLRMDEAILEALVASYLVRVGKLVDLGFDPVWPLHIVDAGFRTWAMPGLRGPRLAPSALLVRPFCRRPLGDLPTVEDRNHVAQVLALELGLVSVGLTTMDHMDYQLRRCGKNHILLRVMGDLKLLSRADVQAFDTFERLLAGHGKLRLRYPNVQVGFGGKGERPVLFDLGGVEFCTQDSRAWILRAKGCDFELVQLRQDVLERAQSKAAPVHRALTAVADRLAARHVKVLRGAGYGFGENWGSSLERIAVGIAHAYGQTGASALQQIDETAEAFADTVRPLFSPAAPERARQNNAMLPQLAASP